MSQDRLLGGPASADLHRKAERLMLEADKAETGGHLELAKRLHLDIAGLETRVLDMIPLTRPRTRAILGLSAVALYFKGGSFEEAKTLAQRVLDELDNSTFAGWDYYKTQVSEIVRQIDSGPSPI